MIRVENLTHIFNADHIINNLSFELTNGIHGLMGDSGSGKTTLLKIIAGIIKPSAGSAYADGPIAVSFQENRLFPWYSALKNVELVSDKETAELLLSQLGLSQALNKKPAELSGGMKKRVSLARALAANSKTVLLDEPFAGLDTQSALNALHVIREHTENKSVIISTHDINISKLLDSIIKI